MKTLQSKREKPAASATFTRIKTLAYGYWSMSETNILTNKLDSYQGGHYSMNDTIFSETNTFANSNNLYLLGETQLFGLEVKKDTLIQTGIDNDTDEVWIRVE